MAACAFSAESKRTGWKWLAFKCAATMRCVLASSSTTQMTAGLSKRHHHHGFVMEKRRRSPAPGHGRRGQFPIGIEAAQPHARSAQGVADDVNFSVEFAAPHFFLGARAQKKKTQPQHNHPPPP